MPMRTVAIAALLCGVCGVAVAAQLAPPLPHHAPVKVSGRVINSVTSEPVRRALVQAEDQAVLTDAEGRFQFEVDAGSYVQFTARKPGFLNDDEQERNRNGQSSRRMVGGQTLIIKLTPEALIAGNVRAVDGEPLERVRIRAVYEHIVEGRKVWQSRLAAPTDEDGDFRLANLPPGDFYLVADATPEVKGLPFRLATRAGQAQGYPTTYYPDAPERASATVMHLAAGQQERAYFLLHRVPLYDISGVVAGIPEGGGARVQVEQGGLPVHGNFAETSGKFQLNAIPAGTYTVVAHGSDANGSELYAERQITLARDVSNLQLALEPGLSIPINVQRVATRAAKPTKPGVTRSLGPDMGAGLPVLIRLLQPDRFGMPGGNYMGTVSPQKPTGFSVDNVVPGKYLVSAMENAPWYVESIRRGSVDLAKEEMVVSPGEQEPIEVVLRDDSARLRGQMMREGHPVEGSALLVPDSGAGPLPIFAQGEQGRFEQTGIAPGGYSVLAFDDLDGLEYTNPEALRPYLPKAVHVTLQPNQETTLELEPIGRAE